MRAEMDREGDLRRQHKEFTRENKVGHNARSTKVTMHELGHRRARRRWNMWMQRTVVSWNEKYNLKPKV